MKIKLQAKFNKIKESGKKLFPALARHLFWSILASLLLVLVIGGITFYKYSILAQKTKAQTLENQVQFKDELYQKLLEIWQGREEGFRAIQTKEYPNPFQP